MIDRRDFLILGAAAGLGLNHTQAAAQASGIRRHARLGRTELKVSDISFGSASSAEPQLIDHALARGINYFDTAESYRSGDSEEAIGAALQGKRNKVILSTKTKASARDTRQDMMTALDASLKRLRTDYVDIYFNHSVNDVKRMQNQEWWEFTALAKKQGKIRFHGMSGHGSNLVDCLDYVIDENLVDVVLVAYNFGHDPRFTDKLRHTFHWAALQPELPRVLEKAKKKDIGVIAMKTLMGGKLNDMRPYERPGSTFAQAAFRWVLASKYADTLIVSMTSNALIDEYVAASGELKVGQRDFDLLARYAQMQMATYCVPGCNACESSCPATAPIAEVLRTRMYAVDYGDARLAREEYAQLEGNANACLSCSGQPCLNACPKGLPIGQFMRDAAMRLG